MGQRCGKKVFGKTKKSPSSVKKSQKPAKLRSSITPGTVLILLAGRFRGKRVVALKQLESGLVLVTGPYAVNGVPLRRVNQRYCIATSTKVDLKGADYSKITDKDFARETKKATKKGESSFFADGSEKSSKPEEKKAMTDTKTTATMTTTTITTTTNMAEVEEEAAPKPVERKGSLKFKLFGKKKKDETEKKEEVEKKEEIETKEEIEKKEEIEMKKVIEEKEAITKKEEIEKKEFNQKEETNVKEEIQKKEKIKKEVKVVKNEPLERGRNGIERRKRRSGENGRKYLDGQGSRGRNCNRGAD